MTGAKLFAFFATCFALGQLFSGIAQGQWAYATTTLAIDTSATSTTITVVSTENFLSGPDEITIGDESIRYNSKDDTHFYGVTRGIDDTTATAHVAGEVVMNRNSNIINNILGYNVAATSASYGSLSAIVGLLWNSVKAIPRMIAWNYSYLDGHLAMLKYLILWPISAGFIFSLGIVAMVLARGIFNV